MCRHFHKAVGIMKNQGNMTSPKGHSKLPLKDAKKIEIHELPDKEFKYFF